MKQHAAISLAQKSLWSWKGGSNFLQNVGKIYQTSSQKIRVSWGQVAQDLAESVINTIINPWFHKRNAFLWHADQLSVSHQRPCAILYHLVPGSPLAARSSAVVRSHICMAPLLWPVKINLRGLDPMRLEPSHSWTQNEVMVVPSTALITHTLPGNK